MSPSSQTVAPGASTTYTVTMTASGGFNGAVSLGVSGLPSGAGASCNPASLSPTSSSCTLTVTTTASTPTGTSTLTITGTSGSISHTITTTLTVSPARAISFINRSAYTGSGGGGVGSVSTTINATSGNLLVVLLSAQSNGAMPTVTDSAGNTWHTAVTPYGGGSNNYLAVAYAYNITGAANDVVTATYGSTYLYNELVVDQFSGELTSSDPLENTSTAIGYGTAISSTAIASSGDAVAFLTEDYPLETTTSGTYTLNTDDTYFTDGYGVATGTQAASATLSTNTNWYLAAVTFKPAT